MQHLNVWGSTNTTSTVALTAYVLIAMDKTAGALTGNDTAMVITDINLFGIFVRFSKVPLP